MKTLFAFLFAFMAVVSPGAAEKKILLVAGKQSHGPGDHEFNAGSMLLAKCLNEVPGIKASVEKGGWPTNETAFEGVDAVLFYMDGGARHPVAEPSRMAKARELAAKGVGIGFAHYGVEVVAGEPGKTWQDLIGGYYENQFSVNPMWAPEFKSFPNHPITRGVKPFSIRDEWYFNMRFRPDMKGITPILVAKPSDDVRDGPYVSPRGPYEHIVKDSGRDETMMWAVENPNGQRGFGFTGGHIHRNWGDENFRKVMLNGLVWLAKGDVPKDGIPSTVTEEDLKQNLDPKKK
jgi:hypothetical protein